MNRLLEIILIVVAFETNSDDIFGSDESVTSAPEDDVSTISNYEGFDKTCFGMSSNLLPSRLSCNCTKICHIPKLHNVCIETC